MAQEWLVYVQTEQRGVLIVGVVEAEDENCATEKARVIAEEISNKEKFKYDRVVVFWVEPV